MYEAREPTSLLMRDRCSEMEESSLEEDDYESEEEYKMKKDAAFAAPKSMMM